MRYLLILIAIVLACSGGWEIRLEPPENTFKTHSVKIFLNKPLEIKSTILTDWNNDNILNPGECGRFILHIKNTGKDTLKDVTLIFHIIEHPEIINIPERYELGVIPPDAEKTAIIVLCACKCKSTTVVPIEMIFNKAHEFLQSCTLNVIVMPRKFVEFEIVKYEIIDEPVIGLPNHKMGAGEKINLKLFIKNKGNVTCNNVNILLTSNENIQFKPNEFIIKVLKPNDVASISTRFSIPRFYSKSELDITIRIIEYNLKIQKDLTMVFEVEPFKINLYKKMKPHKVKEMR